ncbi:VWA domain-containing protein [Sneathiella litorea]|uniref:VWA domain-containing protein n=1 Tax=Sneathiella litorea TaxID=2606216 RepID=A0A6L8W8X0_9PROT|nr:VWA domain-containing protein [Sneathiella litorea]MZR31129.1 VWA domain-containing protein [Sneathiella litorea]
MAKNIEKTEDETGRDDVAEFLKKVAATPVRVANGKNGRLIFAIDATASRQPTWDRASHLQHEMFEEAAAIGGLELQIAFFRGFGEFKATGWTSDSQALIRPMSRVFCLGGHTQIEKVLKHALRQTKKERVNALVYVGDCMEEDADQLCHLAGQLGMLKVPIFLFQEGHDTIAENCFRQIGKLSGGAYCRFDSASAATLRNLLRAVAAYAAGGRKALSDLSQKSGGEARLLLKQIK